MRPDDVLGFFLVGGCFRLGLSGLGRGIRKRQMLQCVLEHFVDPLHCNNRQLVLDVLRNFGQILLVFLGDEDGTDATTMGRQQLLFEAANRQHFTPLGYLTGHRHIALHRDVG